MKVKKAVIPIAGKGTRFLPATKETAKEIIPIINIPMIHYIVDEVIRSGLEEIIFVTSEGKEPVENYFKRNEKLEEFLQKNGKTDLYETIKEIGSMAEIRTVIQNEQLGLGHAIACAKEIVGKDDFACLLGDDLVIGDNPATKQLLEINEKYNESVIGVMEVSNEDTNKYGIVAGEFLAGDSKTLLMNRMIEKPDPSEAPTNLATPGRYVLKNEIFQALDSIERGAGGEYQLTDAIDMLAKDSKVYAHIFEGDRFDTGNIKGYLNATLEFALRDNTLKPYMLEIMNEKMKRFGE